MKYVQEGYTNEPDGFERMGGVGEGQGEWFGL